MPVVLSRPSWGLRRKERPEAARVDAEQRPSTEAERLMVQDTPQGATYSEPQVQANSKRAYKPKGSGLRVHFKDAREAAQAAEHLKDVTLQKRCCHSVVTMAELVGVPQPAVGGTQGRGPKKRAEFLLHVLRKEESNADLRGSEQTPVTEHVRVSDLAELTVHVEMVRTEKEQMVPKPEEEGAQNKISRKKSKEQKLRAPGINSA
ncbi:hypothetical protein HPG69_018931 [Diceros bicornis minor]|uniref:Uncharacterized protein n=1 Tax=Diceros bicornis minor TaxID=77932 RepID=A0A7J7EI53_DICBM|nr:hypothetical protein HPG69_018931 [Diceros bicornis minor]